MELKYSTDEETYNHDSIHEAGESAFDDVGVKVGDIRTIYAGEPVKFTASDFMPNDLEAMMDMAYEEMGEYCDSWPDCTVEQGKELVDLIKAAVDSWADKHGKQPSFYSIKNSRPINIKLLEDDEYEEVLSA
jgi:hypothetical protein